MLVGGQYAPRLTDRCYFLDFEPGDLPAAETWSLRVFNRDYMRVFTRLYPQTRSAAWRDIRDRKEFYLVVGGLGEMPPELPPDYCPGFSSRQLDGRLYRMTRTVASPPTATP